MAGGQNKNRTIEDDGKGMNDGFKSWSSNQVPPIDLLQTGVTVIDRSNRQRKSQMAKASIGAA